MTESSDVQECVGVAVDDVGGAAYELAGLAGWLGWVLRLWLWWWLVVVVEVVGVRGGGEWLS